MSTLEVSVWIACGVVNLLMAAARNGRALAQNCDAQLRNCRHCESPRDWGFPGGYICPDHRGKKLRWHSDPTLIEMAVLFATGPAAFALLGLDAERLHIEARAFGAEKARLCAKAEQAKIEKEVDAMLGV